MNPTDTARALVKDFDEAVRDHEGALLRCLSDATIAARAKTYSDAVDALLAHVAGVEQQLARYKEIYESNSAAFIAIRKAFGIEADETVVPYILKYAPPLATRPTEARDDG